MPLYAKRKVIAIKSEVTPGTDSVPTAAANAILTRNFRISPLAAEGEDRDFDISYVGNKGFIVAGKPLKFSFDVEMAGAGAAGTAPGYAPLLKACGMSETLNGGVSAVYTPVNPGGETPATLYFFMGGRRHRATFCLGSMKLSIARGKAGFFSFEFIGIYVAPDDIAFPTPTLTAYQKPVAVTNQNTTPFTLDGFAGKYGQLMADIGVVNVYRNLVGGESVRMVDRNSKASVKLEDELIAGKDWWTKLTSGALVALSAQHGTVAGNIVTFAAPNVQLDPRDVGIDAEDNISMLSMSLMLTPSSAGNDEWSITVK